MKENIKRVIAALNVKLNYENHVLSLQVAVFNMHFSLKFAQRM